MQDISVKRFKLEKATVALGNLDGKRIVVKLPEGATFEVESGPPDREGLVRVCCDGEKLLMFAIDVERRGQQIADGASA